MKKELMGSYHMRAVIGIAICTLLAARLATATVNVGSGWVWQNPLPQGNNLEGITCSSAGGSLNCIAVGDLGTILVGTASNGGAISWTGQSKTSNSTQTLYAVACIPGSANYCFAAGDAGTILWATDGVNWTSRPSGVTTGLTGISCSSNTNCVAVGPGLIVNTNDSGTTWVAKPLPGVGLGAVSCPAANTCYAAGNSTNGAAVVLKTMSGGTGWGTTPLPGSPATVKAISCGSSTNCVAVATDGSTWATTDGGIGWAFVRLGIGQTGLYGVSCWDAADCVAVGAGPQPNLYRTNNTGATWTAETSGAGAGAVLNAVSCSGGACLSVGQVGQIVANYPLGTVYTDLKATVTSGQLKRVRCVDTNNCWAVGDGGIFATNDGGATWTNQYSALGLLAISCPSATVCFAVDGNLVLGTTNGGKTWASQSVSQAVGLSAIGCPTVTTCFAGGAGTIVATTDGGKTWQPSLIFPQTVNLFGIACPSTTSCIAVGSQGVMFTTFDDKTWKQVTPLTGSNLQDVSCAAASNCIAVGDSGATLITTDGGHNWSLPEFPTTAKSLTGIGCDLDLGCYATTNDGFILFSGLGGLWNQDVQLDASLSGISCAGISGEDRCVAVGDGGTIVSYSIGPSNPDFSLTLQPIFTGKFGVRGFNVIVTALGPFSGTVSLSCNIPGGQSCTLNPTAVVASGTSLMTGPTFLPDWNGLTVTGTSGSLKHTVPFTDNLPPPPPPCKPGPCQ